VRGAQAMVVVNRMVQYPHARSGNGLKRELAQPVVVDLRNIYRPEDMAGARVHL